MFEMVDDENGNPTNKANRITPKHYHLTFLYKFIKSNKRNDKLKPYLNPSWWDKTKKTLSYAFGEGMELENKLAEKIAPMVKDQMRGK